MPPLTRDALLAASAPPQWQRADGTVVTGHYLSVLEGHALRTEWLALLGETDPIQVEARLRALLEQLGLTPAADEVLALPAGAFDEALECFFVAASRRDPPAPPPRATGAASA